MSKKNTKRSLIMSGLALLMCVSMLVGTTFAWFTDSVTSINNKIVAGNLDVELYWSTDATNWTKVDNTTNIFKDNTLWEPGHTEVVYLKVANEGTLALKYQLGVNIVAETAGTNVADEAFLLSDYIYFSAIDGVSNAYADRAEARDAAAADAKIISEGFNKASELLADAEECVALVVYMPETVGNEANYKTGTDAPEIDLGINLVATQLTYENDSYGDDYDEGAVYAANTTDDFAYALATAEAGDTITLAAGVDYGTTEITGDLSGVTIVGAPDAEAFFNISGVADDLTFKSFDLSGYNGIKGLYSGAINVLEGAEADIAFEDCSFAPNSGYAAVRVYEPTAELSFTNCEFTGGRYAVYSSGAPIAKAELTGCTFSGLSSWAVLFNGGGTVSDITISGCTFDGCGDGLAKVLSAPAAGSTFTFTDNTITNSKGHDGKDSEWFCISSTFTITASGNTLDGVAWTPAAAQGLGK